MNRFGRVSGFNPQQMCDHVLKVHQEFLNYAAEAGIELKVIGGAAFEKAEKEWLQDIWKDKYLSSYESLREIKPFVNDVKKSTIWL